MLSFWEKQSFLDYDYLIIGSGIVGLSCAASLIERQPKAQILVLERGIFPTGASTKNAGFACFGSLTEILADLQTMPEQAVLALIEQRYRGLQKLRSRLGDSAIGYEPLGGYELISPSQAHALERLESINQWLFPLFNQAVYHLQDQKIKEFGFDSSQVQSLVFNPLEGQIDTGRMMKSLLAYVQARGVSVMSQTPVERIEDTGKQANVWATDQLSGHSVRFSASKVIVATNAFAENLIKGQDIKAGRGQVLITEPIPSLKFRGAFHLDEGYYYFRNVGNRVLLGGGRHLDFEGETTTQIATTERIMHALQDLLTHLILPKQPFQIAHRWAGIMAFGQTKQAIITHNSPHVVLALRMGGMGVAIGSQVGEQVSRLLSQEA